MESFLITVKHGKLSSYYHHTIIYYISMQYKLAFRYPNIFLSHLTGDFSNEKPPPTGEQKHPPHDDLALLGIAFQLGRHLARCDELGEVKFHLKA